MLAYVIHAQIPKILRAYEQDVPYGTMTYQCRQLKLSPLSTQIIIYYLMTNQTPTFLIQRAP